MTQEIRNYQEKIVVSASPEAGFAAVATQMNQWWTTSVEGRLAKVGDKLTVRFPPDFGHWTFEAMSLVPGRLIEMICIDAHHKVEGQPKEIDREWLGTRIIWQFDRIGEKTEITLTHDGLTPQLNCWDICLDGWNHFFKTSLRAFLEGEAPSPHTQA